MAEQQGPQSYVLRVLSGPHQGAEVPLQETPFSIGKGESSDVVLMDGELQEQHAQFFVRGGKCFCAPMSGAKVFIESTFVSKEIELEDFDAIVCGTTLVSVGPKDTAWPTIAMPDMENVEEESEEPESEEDAKAEGEKAEDDNAGEVVANEEAAQEEGAQPKPQEDSAAETPPQEKAETGPAGANTPKTEDPKADTPKPEASKTEAPKKETPAAGDKTKAGETGKANASEKQPQQEEKIPFFKKTLFKIIVVVGTFLILVCYFSSSKKKDDTEQTSLADTQFPIMTLRKSIEAVLGKREVDPEFVKIGLSGQKFVFQCYVKTSQEKQELQKELRALPKVIFQSIHIYVQNILMDQAQSLLGKYTLYVKPGKKLDTILLTGYLYSIDQLTGIKNMILKDVPGINGIETTLLSPDEIYNLASNVLVQYDLMGLLKLQPVRTGLMITGHLQASQEPRWKSAQKTLKQSFNGICKVLTYVAVVDPQAVKNIYFPSPITTVSIPENEKPWIDLKNGDRYYEGALLPSSYYIQSITQKGIRLHKNDDSVFFELSEL